LIIELHESSSAGHIGVVSTLAKALNRIYWKRLRQDVNDVALCRMSPSKDSTADGCDSLPITRSTQTVAYSWSCLLDTLT
jgi:hypothetical protein